MTEKQIYTIETPDNINNVLGQYSFEDAIELTGFGKFNILMVIMCGLGILGVIAESISLSIIIPSANCDLELTSAMKGILTTILVAGVLVASQLWGYLGDTRGRRSMMILPVFTSVLVTFLASFSPNFYTLFILRFTSGLLLSSSASIVYAYVSEFHGPKHRAAVLTFTSSFVALASVTVPALGWLTLPGRWYFDVPLLGIQYKPWRFLLALCSLPSLIFILMLLCFPESPRFLLQINESASALEILQNIYASNTGKNKNTFPVNKLINTEDKITFASDKKPTCLLRFYKQLIPIFLPPFWKKTLLVSTLQFGAFYAGLGVYNWIPQILNEFFDIPYESTVCDAFSKKNEIILFGMDQGGNLTEIETCVSTVNIRMLQSSFFFGLVMFVVYLIAASLVKYIGNKIILVILFSVTGLSCCFLHVVKHYWLTLFLMNVFILANITVGLINSFTPDMFPTKYRAMAISVSFMIGRIGGVVGSNVMGVLLDFDCHLAFYLSGGILLFCAFLSLQLPPRLNRT